jgi:hypothetical protein
VKGGEGDGEGAGRRLIALAVLLTVPGLAAQRGADLRSAPTEPFALTDWGGRVGFESVFRHEEQTSEGGGEFERDLTRFEEYVEFTGEGYIYHPLFISHESRVRLGLLQQEFDSDPGESDSFNDLLQEYDLSLLFFREKPVSTRLWGQRRDDVVRDLFSDVLEIEEDAVGGDLMLNSPHVPSRLSVAHREFDRTGFSSDSEGTLDTVEAVSRIRPGTDFSTDLHYLFRDFEEDFTSRTDGVSVDRRTLIESHDLSAINVARFGPGSRHRLTSSGRFYDQTGTLDLRQWRAGERLDLRLTDRLDSFLSYAFDRLETDTQDSTTHRGRGGFHHRLYESLDTTVEGRWRRTDFDIGDDETEVGGGTRFAYRKHTPRGLLTGGYGIDIDNIDRGEGGVFRTVTDEQVVLLDGTVTLLSRENVSLPSVAVTDVSGLVTFVLDLDYRLTVIGNRVRIERIFGGAIANGQLVLVDYQFFQPEDVDFTQFAQFFNLRHDWTRGSLENLALYYRLGDLRNSGSTGGTEILEFTQHLAGANYRWRWFDFTEEYEVFDANISPHNTWRSAVAARFTPWRRSRLRTGAEYLMIDFTDSGEEDTDLLNLTADLRTDLGRHVEWELQSLYRKETGRNDEDNFGVATSLRWAYRKLTVELGLRYEFRDRSATERDDIAAFISVTREL